MAEHPRKDEQPAPVVSDPLSVIPKHAPDVDVRFKESGEAHLRIRFAADGRLMRFLQYRLGWRRERYINLDQRGTEFWNLLDGERSLAHIAALVAEMWDLDEEKAERVSVEYVRQLMLRNLVILEVRPGEQEGREQ